MKLLNFVYKFFFKIDERIEGYNGRFVQSYWNNKFTTGFNFSTSLKSLKNAVDSLPFANAHCLHFKQYCDESGDNIDC